VTYYIKLANAQRRRQKKHWEEMTSYYQWRS